MRINDVVAGKHRQEVVTIGPDARVRDLLARLEDHQIGALVVSRDGSTVEGIVSERDVVRRLVHDEATLEARVADLMSTEVRTVGPDAHLDTVMQLMTEHRIRHVPVLVDGRLVGIVSIGDVVKHRLRELEFERDQLDSFVHGQQS